MKAPVRTTIIVCLLASVPGIPGNAGEKLVSVPRPEDPEAAVVTEASSRFGFDLYRQLAKENPGGNLFFSPWSVFGALSMTVEGAREETAVEMGTVMGFPGIDPCPHRGAADAVRGRPEGHQGTGAGAGLEESA
jgi:serine protease inhibitor